jgi:hypothetical protein
VTKLDLLTAQREKLGAQLRDDLTCDTCGAPATMVHLLPWCVDTTEVALSGDCACRTEQAEDLPEEGPEGEEIVPPRKLPEQLDCGYHFRILEWTWDYSHESGEKWSMRDQVSEKIDGEQTVAMVDRRLKVAP